MNLKSKFLTLPIKDQICLIIIGLYLFCLLVLLSICGSLAYEILKEDFYSKKLYFFDIYRDYIESCVYFQNFYLLQYEEIIKRMQKQMWDHLQVSQIYNFKSNFENNNNKLSKIDINSYYTLNSNFSNSLNNENNLLFLTCFDNSYNSQNQCLAIENLISNQYETLSSLIFSHNIYNSFRMPFFEKQIIDTTLFFNINRYTMYSFNSYIMFQKINEICGNEFNIVKIFNYYDKKQNLIIKDVKEKLIFFFGNTYPLLEHMFEKIINEIKFKYHLSNDNNYYSFDSLAYLACGYFSKMDYGNNKFYLINNLEELYFYYYIESNIINDYLYFVNNKISSYIDMYFIPLFFENNTIISPKLCISFLLKQLGYHTDINKVIEYLKQIVKGESKIEECFIDENILDSQIEIKDIFISNFNKFIFVKNISIDHGILNLGNCPYYFIKYTYPNYNSLKDFKSDYFLLDQINYYFFASFQVPIKFTNLYYQISTNCFYLIILIILYCLGFSFIVNIIIFYKIISQLTEPIKKLKEAIKSGSIKDENIFKYEYDDFINELFVTCKELLTGQIENNNHENEKYNFNFLSKSKEKKKDIYENRYLQNLIINHDIMNNLMNQKQTMMDFSKNIELNDFNNEQNLIIKKSSSINKSFNHRKNSLKEKFNLSNNSNDEINEINKKSKDYKKIKNKNEEKEKEDREPYKKLFQISEYFYYYQNKIENNYININNNTIIEDSQSSNISNNQKNSINLSSRINKSIKRGDTSKINNDNENISVNMLNHKNISYLWYMEAKKKKNKSLNYKVSNNYDELFMEYNS